MGINRVFLGAFSTKVFGEEIKEKHDTMMFDDDILQKEYSKLMQVVSKMEKKWNTEDLSKKYDLKEECHLPFGE